MIITKDNATFSQNKFNFYIGNIEDEGTISFKEDYIIIGNIKTLKNIFAIGELIVFGDINCKSIYASKDFFCLGNIDTELVEVEGKSKILLKEELENNNIQEIQNDIVQNQEAENKKEDYCKQEIDNICNTYKDSNTISYVNSRIINRDEVEEVVNNLNESEDLSKLYEKYINKKGEIVFGKVLRIEENKYIVQLDDIEGQLLKTKERNFKIGDTVSAYIQSVKYENTNLEIELVENDRSYITKIIKLEMKKNKYDFDKVFIKEINKQSENKYIVYIYSDQHTQETLDAIENALNQYSNGREIKLHIYKEKSNKIKDMKVEINKNIDQVLDYKNGTIKQFNSINNFYVDDIVYHKKFGKGKILSIIDKDIAKIEFNGVDKNLNLTYLINNKLISKDDIYDHMNMMQSKKEDSNIVKKLKKESISKTKTQILEKYEQKRYTLIEANVASINENYIEFNINNEAIGILKKENDCVKDKVYNIGEKVICYISSVYIKEDKVEIQIYRNTSNFFKLLFNKYKEELDLKKYNLKLCKFTKSLGARLVVERKNGFNDELMLNYINQLINKDAGADIVKIIVLQYSPYTFLSELFNIKESSIQLKNSIYYLNNIPKENIDSINDIINEIHKVVSYKVSIND